MKRKFVPRKGQVFTDRQELLDRLLDSGWEWEGTGTGLSDGKVTSYNVGVLDQERDLWLMVDLKPTAKGLRVVKVSKLKLSDYES